MKPMGIVLHLTASTYGDAAEVDKWHKENGWSGIGYHRLILNGKRRATDPYDSARDGRIEKGRPDDKQGAHCLAKGMNKCTFGVCCVGMPGTVPAGAQAAPATLTTKTYLTARQATVLVDTVARLCTQFGWNPKGSFVHPVTGKKVPVITQHSDHDPGNKPFCASLNVPAVRDRVAARIAEMAAGGAILDESVDQASFEPVDDLAEVEEHGVEPESDVPPVYLGSEIPD